MNLVEIESELTEAANQLETIGTSLAAEGPEFAEPREGRATVHWTGPLTWGQAINQGRGRKGTYIIYRRASGRLIPVTNGITETRDLASRISGHRGQFHRTGWDDDQHRVRLGIMPRFSVSRARAVEHSVRREHDRTATGREKRRGRLTGYPRGPMRVGSGKFVEITHRGKVPAVLRRKLKGQKIRYGPGLHEVLELPLADQELEARLATTAYELESEAPFG